MFKQFKKTLGRLVKFSWGTTRLCIFSLGVLMAVSYIPRVYNWLSPYPKWENGLLMVDMEQEFSEECPPPAMVFLKGSLSFYQLIKTLRASAKDPNIRAILMRINGCSLGLAQIQELRMHIKEITKIKPVFVFSYGFNPMGRGMAPYYLASAATQIFLSPIGGVGLHGLGGESLFYKKILDTWGIGLNLYKREEYKSFPEMWSRENFSEPAKESMLSWFRSLQDQIVQGVSQDRKLDPKAFEAMVAEGSLSTKFSLKQGLVDKEMAAFELLSTIKAYLKMDDAEELTNVSLGEFYAARVQPVKQKDFLSEGGVTEKGNVAEKGVSNPNSAASGTVAANAPAPMPALTSEPVKKSDPKKSPHKSDSKFSWFRGRSDDCVAVIAFSGPLGDGGDFMEKTVNGAKISSILIHCANQDRVKAIVLRVDTPGGSSLAAEMIREGVMRCRGEGKTVVVSMGNAATSGGYWIASAADEIVAEPTTVTGSIGVFCAKFNVAGLLEKIGVTVDSATLYDNALTQSQYRAYTVEEGKKMEAFIDEHYQYFLKLVAEGRKLSLAKVHSVAKGRVWSGIQAKELGLVDTLGGLITAIQRAKILAHLPMEADVEEVGAVGTFWEVLSLVMGDFFAGARAYVLKTLSPGVKVQAPDLPGM